MRDRSLWTWHIAAGAVMVVLLGLHMVNMHLDAIVGIFNPAGRHPIDWENVVARGREVGFAVFYIVLLAAGLFHGLYGLRNILLEMNLKPGWQKGVTVVLLLAGIGFFALGTWSAIVGFQVARSV